MMPGFSCRRNSEQVSCRSVTGSHESHSSIAMLSRALLFASSVSALSTPYALHARQANTTVSGLEVDLGYSVYKGWHNASANLNIFQG